MPRQRRSSMKVTQELFEQVPPQDLDAEKAVLGSIILDHNVLDGLDLERQDFYTTAGGKLFEHLSNLPGTGPVDAVLLKDFLKGADDWESIGGAAFLAECSQTVPYIHHAAFYARLVKQTAIRRRIILRLSKGIQDAWDDTYDVDALPHGIIADLDSAAVGKSESARFAELLTSADLDKADFRQHFLIPRILVAGQPGVIGGRTKALKTTIAIDLVLSLGSGTPFLGHFDCDQVAVGFWSGESGDATIQNTARRIAKAKGIDLANCSVYWSFDVPQLSRPDHIGRLIHIIEKRGLKVIVVDPLYLALLSPQSSTRPGDLFAMGQALQPIAEIARKTGCTPILLHHFRKNTQADDADPAALEELSQSGVAEFVRQWLLLQRRTPYAHDGHHSLYMRAGGSAGHAGLWGLEIEEGTFDDPLYHRYWSVEVSSISDLRAETERARAEKSAVRNAARDEKRDAECRERVFEALKNSNDWETAKSLRPLAGFGLTRTERGLHLLQSESLLEITEGKHRNGITFLRYKLL